VFHIKYEASELQIKQNPIEKKSYFMCKLINFKGVTVSHYNRNVSNLGNMLLKHNCIRLCLFFVVSVGSVTYCKMHICSKICNIAGDMVSTIFIEELL
jgi:hypothetical protein